MGKDCDVFDIHGTICLMLCCNCMTSSCNSLFSVLSWSRSFLVLANFWVIIFSFSFVSSSSFLASLRVSVELLLLDVAALCPRAEDAEAAESVAGCLVVAELDGFENSDEEDCYVSPVLFTLVLLLF